MSLLNIKNLTLKCGTRKILNRVNFSMKKEEIVALVAPSGSGKSLLAKSIMGLLPEGIESEGLITFNDKPFTSTMRGKEAGLIFQDPFAALNPTLTIGQQITDGIIEHLGASKRLAKEIALTWMERLSIPKSALRFDQYPINLSGGMLQRVHIASFLALKPKLLICDEITTALDATTKLQLLIELKRIVKEEKSSLLFITHDRGCLKHLTDRIIPLQTLGDSND